MSSGLYPNMEMIERSQASYSAASIGQVFVAPADLVVVGLLAVIGTAPGGSASVLFNVSNSPTSQLAVVSPYNLWTTANTPAIVGTSKNSFTTSTSQTVIQNSPYALNYPFPGPSGQQGYKTAQTQVLTTETPVVAPPTLAVYQMGALTAPDNTYSDFNGQTQPASLIHAGDILTFSVAAGTGGAGSAAGAVEIILYCQKS